MNCIVDMGISFQWILNLRNSVKAKHGPSWRDEVFEWALMIGCSPFWVPMVIIRKTATWVRIRTYVWRPIDAAWRKCSSRWESDMFVSMQAPHVERTFDHRLAVDMGKAHSKKRAFFLKRLMDPNPILVGYAFKCLIRVHPKLQIHEIPAEVLERSDVIPILWADLVDRLTVGDFVRGYFAEQELLKRIRSGELG